MGHAYEGTLIQEVRPGEEATVPVQAHRNLAQQRRHGTSIPEGVIEYFHGMNMKVRWGSKDEIQQGMDETIGFTPVLIDDIPEDVRSVFPHSMKRQPDGTITRGDMILQWRSNEDHDIQRHDEAIIRQSLEDPNQEIERFMETLPPDKVHFDNQHSSVHPIQGDIGHGYSTDVLEAVEQIVQERKAQERVPSKIDDDLKSIAQSAGKGKKK